MVFLCDDLRLPGKQWAVKRMNNPEPAHFNRLREAFAIEAVTLSQLAHPNLPALVDYFEEGHDLYLVTEFVEGENLAEHVLRCGPLPESEAFTLGLTLLDILEYLHGRNVVFRDLKPENVMIATDGTIKLIDFGLARRLAPDMGDETIPSGSVGYAAPEQWEDTSHIDVRGDIYSWGATVLHLLSGKIPSPVFPMSALSREAGGVAVSARGRAILEKCLKARSSQRYRSVSDLARDLRTLVGIETSNVTSPAVAGPTVVASAVNVTKMDGTGARERLPDGDELNGSGTTNLGVRSVTSVPRRRATDAIRTAQGQKRLDTSPWRVAGHFIVRLPTLVTSSPALALLLVATIQWLLALSFMLPTQTSAEHGTHERQAGAGVVPYRQLLAEEVRRERAKSLYQHRRWEEALAILDELTVETPQDAELHILAQNIYVFLSREPFTVIPFVGADSGADAFDSRSHLYGLALGQSTINARGGIRGRKVVVELYDDASRVSRCLYIAEKLARDRSILVVMGPTASQRMLAIAPVLNNAHLSIVAPTASSEQIWEAGPYVFTASDTRTPRVRALADYEASMAKEEAGRAGRSPPTVGVIAERSSRISNEMAAIFVDEMGRGGVLARMLTSFEENQTDFSEQVRGVADLSPDVVFFADYKPTTVANFATQLRAAHLGTRLCAQTIAYVPGLAEAGSAVDGLVLCEYFHPQLDTPAMHAFMVAFRRKFGDLTPPYAVANTFDAFNAVASALENADTRESVRDYLASTGVTRPALDGVSGRFAFGRRLDARPLWLLEVRDGRFRLLGKANGPPPPQSSPQARRQRN